MSDPGPCLLAALLVLVGALLLVRREKALGRVEEAPDAPCPGSRDALAVLLVLVAAAPVLWVAPLLLHGASKLVGDAASHADVARQMASGGSRHGWFDVHNGGFPLFLHYQPLAILLSALLMALGVPPAVAVNGLGLAAILGSPLLLFYLLRRSGVTPVAALAGVLIMALVSVKHPLDGGFDAYLRMGLLSQVVAIPVALLFADAVFRRREGASHVWLGALLPAAHTQISVAAVAVCLAAALVVGGRTLRKRALVGAAAAVGTALALYDAGLLRFDVPFGSPATVGWQARGFDVTRLPEWLIDGDLLDYDRPPLLTWLCQASGFVLLLTARRDRRSRALLALLVATLAFCVSGSALLHLGGPGQLALRVMSPQRAMPLLLPIAGGMVAVAVDVAVTRVRRALCGMPPLATHAATWGPWLACATVTLLLPGGRLAWMRPYEQMLRSADCTSPPGPGFDATTLRAWAARPGRGRLAFPDFEGCAASLGPTVVAPRPLGATYGGPGSQVAELELAFNSIHLDRPGSADRAEALGVRTVIHAPGIPPGPGEGWETIAAQGRMVMSERMGGTDLFGLGCVRERWAGGEPALREALRGDLATAGRSLAPRDFIELDRTEDPGVVRGSVTGTTCDPRGAVVHEVGSPETLYAAEVASPAPVDVVLRATSVSDLWSVKVDGEPVAPMRLAPGFIGIHLAAGAHRVTADPVWPHFYGLGLAVDAGLLVLLAWASRRGRRGGGEKKGAGKTA